jgi:hypothetical protein
LKKKFLGSSSLLFEALSEYPCRFFTERASFPILHIRQGNISFPQFHPTCSISFRQLQALSQNAKATMRKDAHGAVLLFLTFGSLFNPVSAKWDDYPACAEPILDERAPSYCYVGPSNYTNDKEGNACLCPNQGFLFDVAQGVYKQCGCAVLETVATVLVSNCNGTGTPAAYNEKEIIQLGSGQPDGCSTDGGLSLGDKIALGVGVPVCFFGFVGLVLQLLAALGWIRQTAAPWHHIRRWCCCCC